MTEPPRHDRTTILARCTTARTKSAALAATAQEMREQNSRYRNTAIPRRRYATMQAILRARHLRFDPGGPILAMWNGDGPAESEPVPAATLEEIVTRLFGVSLTLSAALQTLDGPARPRLQKAIYEMDSLIKDVRLAAFHPDLNGAASSHRLPDPAGFAPNPTGRPPQTT